MMKNYLWDIIFIVMAAVTAFILAGTPGTIQSPETRPAPPASTATLPEMEPVESSPKSGSKAIGERNIFSSSGNYKDTIQTVIPNNPYTLLGVVQEGLLMKAVFREYTGAVKKAAAGQRMIDGFQIATVQSRQVMLKKGSEKKVFDVYGNALSFAAEKDHVKKFSDIEPILVGILEGANKKAVFKDHTGNFTILEIGRSLPDGSVIDHIDSRSVKLRNGKNKKDLTLYAQAFFKEPVGVVRSLSNDKPSPAPAPVRKRHKSPNNIVEDQDQGGGQ